MLNSKIDNNLEKLFAIQNNNNNKQSKKRTISNFRIKTSREN